VSEAAAMSCEAAHSGCDRQITCPICSSRGNWSFDSRFVEVHRCENQECTHLFAVDVDSNHGVMNDVDADAERSMYAERNERLVAFWEGKAFVTGGSRLLDVGAGTGHLARSVKSRIPGIEIHCIEESGALRDRLDHQGFEVSQNLDAILAGRSFDAVLLIEVIEHVPDPVDVLNRLRGLLDPKGRIFLTTPCGELRNGSLTTNAYNTPEHVQFFTEKSLRLAVEKAGFSSITYEYIDALYPRSPNVLSFATFKRFAKMAARPILAALQGPRHLTGFIDR
jgi:2-polyprenyl-3-methyl-5-hydroxy-6-metoxy-1,4-benzoquinol methylase